MCVMYQLFSHGRAYLDIQYNLAVISLDIEGKEEVRTRPQVRSQKTFLSYILFKINKGAIYKSYLSKLCIAFNRQCFNEQKLCSIHGIIVEIQ